VFQLQLEEDQWDLDLMLQGMDLKILAHTAEIAVEVKSKVLQPAIKIKIQLQVYIIETELDLMEELQEVLLAHKNNLPLLKTDLVITNLQVKLDNLLILGNLLQH